MMKERSPQELREKARSARESAARLDNGLTDSERLNLLRLAYNLDQSAAMKARRLAKGEHPQHPTKQ